MGSRLNIVMHIIVETFASSHPPPHNEVPLIKVLHAIKTKHVLPLNAHVPTCSNLSFQILHFIHSVTNQTIDVVRHSRPLSSRGICS